MKVTSPAPEKALAAFPLLEPQSTHRPKRLRAGIDWAFLLFGWLFCLQWAIAVLVFPAYKERLIGYVPVLAGLLGGLGLCLPRVRSILTATVEHLPDRSFLFAVTILALALRLISVAAFPLEPANDHRYFHIYALNMLDGKGYGGVPWPHLPGLDVDGGPKAFYPPGMSLLLVAWYWLTTPTALAGKLLNVVFGTAMVLLVYDIGRRAVSQTVGRWAALLTAVFPSLVFYNATLGYEIPMGTIWCAIIDMALITGSRPRIWHVLVMGLLLGFGSLLKPICLLMPLLLIAWWWLGGAGWKTMAYGALALVGMAAVVAPWTIRNYRELNGFVLISTNGGYVFYSANNPNSHGIHMVVPAPAGEIDEISMDRVRSRAAVRWILENPIAFMSLAGIKAMLVWGTSSTVMSYVSFDRMPAWQEDGCMALINTAWAAMLTVSFLATWKGVWRERTLYLAFLCLAYLFALHVVFEAHSRHHVPVLGLLMVVAAYGLSGVSTETVEPQPSPS